MAVNETHIEIQLAHLEEQIKALSAAFVAEKVSSKEAIAAAFTAAETATETAFKAQKESAEKSEKNAQAQLEMHNGLIRKMDSLVGTYPDKESVKKDLESRDARISSLDRQVARAYGVAAGAVALAGTAMAVVFAGHA